MLAGQVVVGMTGCCLNDRPLLPGQISLAGQVVAGRAGKVDVGRTGRFSFLAGQIVLGKTGCSW